jgi:citrate lyase subunit beta/citryl-CoA lyase
LLVPVTDAQAIERACASGADGICLDLEDTVAPARKAEARTMLRGAIERCAPHADVLVRVNIGRKEVEADLDAAVWPGLSGVRLPKAEESGEVRWLAETLNQLEHERRIEAGLVGISLLIESVRGLFASRQLAAADARIADFNLGPHDFARDLGVEPTTGGDEALLAELALLVVAREAGIEPLAALGRRKDEEATRKRCVWLRSVGYRGVTTSDARAIPIINETFTPT